MVVFSSRCSRSFYIKRKEERTNEKQVSHKLMSPLNGPEVYAKWEFKKKSIRLSASEDPSKHTCFVDSHVA